jgi:glycosyltransferase involved in cell wall biosynthesis
MPSVYAAQAALRSSTPFVLSPRGMLGGAALRFSSGQKKLFWMLLQGRAANRASCLHATSEQEYEDIRAFGLKVPVAIVPNGIDVPSQLSQEAQKASGRTILFLGRIHPKKGVRDLVEAWATLADRHPEWRLEIVGPTEGSYVAEVRRALAHVPRARLAGPLYGAAKTAAYRSADLFVLPTLNENFGMTVAEALAQGTPVICSKGAPWRGLQAHGCGWWVDQGPKALIAALDEAMQLDRPTLSKMGEAGWRWMADDFRWESVASRLTAVYRWLTFKEPRPEYVLVD